MGVYNIIVLNGPKFKLRRTGGGDGFTLKLLYAIPGEKMGRTGLHTCILQVFNGLHLMKLKGQTAPKSVSITINFTWLFYFQVFFTNELRMK